MPRFYNILRGALLVAALATIPASAQVIDIDLIDIDPEVQATLDWSKDGPMSHIESDLRALFSEFQQDKAGRLATGYITVDVLATSAEEAETLERTLQQAGFEPTGRIGALLSGFLPVSAVGDAAEVPILRSLRASRVFSYRGGKSMGAPLVSYRAPFVGAVMGEASKALRADIAKSTYGIDGSGVMIGVISDSYNSLGTAGADVTSNDLPNNVVILDDLASGEGSDEGRAMMQLAYDVAPGADLAFHTGFKGLANFAQGIIDLRDAGADVIVDDLTLSVEPFFQDGLVAQAVDYIAAQGVPYFTSAGNEAAESYEGDYVGTGTMLTVDGDNGGQLHDFDSGAGTDAFLNVTLEPDESIGLTFGYDEPSAAASGISGSTIFVGAPNQAPTSDYDVYVLSSPSTTVTSADVLDRSTDTNTSTGFPLERVDYTNDTGVTQTVYIAITKFSGDDRRIKLYNGGGTGSALANSEYIGASTAVGHANATSGFTVAAAAWFDTAPFNPFIASNQATAGPAALEGSTSLGGLLVRLDIDGNRLATPSDRMKPDATGSDADNNTFFGDDTSEDTDTNPNFFGTSAAAPNVAGVAALMIEAAGGPGSLTAFGVYDALKNTAADLQPGDGYNEGTTAGYDTRSGVGFLNAEAAVASVFAELSATLTGMRGYRVLALPTGGTYDELLGGLWTQGFTGSDRPAPSAGCSAYSYDETAANFEGGYTCLTDQNAVFARGRGAYIYVYADDDLDTPGVQGGFPKTLAVPDPGYTNAGAPFSAFPLTYTNNPTVPSYKEGWNLLGNPLSAGMDWNETVRGGGLTPTIYVLDPNYFGGDYRTWTAGIGGDLPNGVVPTFQGFFAKAVAANPTLVAPVASVVTPGPGVYGKTTPTPLRFELSLDETPVSATFVAVSPEAALGEDVQDAIRLTPNAYPRTVLSTSTIGAEAVPLALNALPTEAAGEIDVPLNVAAEGYVAGPLALTLAWTGDLPEGWRAALIDREAGTSTPLSPGGTYAFTLDVSEGKTRSSALGLDLMGFQTPEASDAPKTGGSADSGDRFALRITPASVVSTGATPEDAFGLSAPAPNPVRGTVRVPYRLSASGAATVTVVDALGRQVATLASGEHSAGNHEATLDVSSLAPGVYVVRLSTPEAASMVRFTVVR